MAAGIPRTYVHQQNKVVKGQYNMLHTSPYRRLKMARMHEVSGNKKPRRGEVLWFAVTKTKITAM
ncbi:hypothetical protein SAMN05444390_1011678 [Marinobacterium lutimaris]|uniref:Uncharacterized protein n=1 Tax=Marinobacterium lutimaris TaxID=568106 RepID=A0A1H5Y9X9_9GAMM|nr:hypothetical protein SAMN05444390_1011678 [Marinobacterium lutimaris]